MENERINRVKGIHLFLGILWIIFGIVALIEASYLISAWVISLGVFFIFDSLKERLELKFSPKLINVIHYILGAILIILGSTALLDTFKII